VRVMDAVPGETTANEQEPIKADIGCVEDGSRRACRVPTEVGISPCMTEQNET